MDNKTAAIAGLALAAAQATAFAACPKSGAAIKALDTEYQAAVQKNDAKAMDRLLPDDFVLVTGKGKVIGKADLLAEARAGEIAYQRQDDSRQTVRFFGDIAVITALLHAKGNERGKPFDYRLWFSDVYLCTPAGWRYAFAQSSIPLPD
ncbi:nuclear transport factor 2 family protein [Luteimonas sp. SX5]|uniref:Nuclear transport factor 2 family protein n=1 Tax=Luteimonas galliterrae TaxID=2940486 RepID=A0ABT0MKE7_9GAMM|nr:nuclear transport factor 2 family protein [Luteimonas galliterrae]MCL1635352.1 nuclear transport factor 2 family protein [Luteimonas galliterrae]